MIRLVSKLIGDESAAAAAELVLALPLLLVLIWGPLEIGNYFMDEHMLVKGVRDGATYAAHQDISNFDCSSGTPTVPQSVKDDTKNIVRSGALSGGTDRLRNWSSASFDVTLNCYTQAGTTTLGGIYAFNTGGKVPVITVTASVPYSPVLGNLGFRPATLGLNASQQATVMGI